MCEAVIKCMNFSSVADVGSSTKGVPDAGSVFEMFNGMWVKLLMLMKQLRNILQIYNEKRQELTWGLETNVLKENFKAIDDSYGASEAGAIGGMCAGMLIVGGGAFFGEAGLTVGNATGQVANGIGTWVSGSETRKADMEKAVAELQNKGAQSYAKTLDDTLMKGREIMQQIMDMGRKLVEELNQMLRAASR